MKFSNNYTRVFFIVLLFVALGFLGALLSQKIIVQTRNDHLSEACVKYDFDCRKSVVSDIGWPFPSQKLLADGTTVQVNANDCLNPLEIFCDKNPEATRYNIPQIYINSTFISVGLFIVYLTFKKIVRKKYENIRD